MPTPTIMVLKEVGWMEDIGRGCLSVQAGPRNIRERKGKQRTKTMCRTVAGNAGMKITRCMRQLLYLGLLGPSGILVCPLAVDKRIPSSSAAGPAISEKYLPWINVATAEVNAVG
jgi:hypothetical protein